MNEVIPSLDELRLHLKQYADEQALLLEITQRIANGGQPGEMLNDVVQTVHRGLQADSVRIVLSDLTPPGIYNAGPLAEYLTALDRTIVEFVTRHGALKMIKDLPAGSEKLAESVKALFAAPLMAHKGSHGVLWVAYKNPHEFSASKRNFITMVAAQAAIAVANNYAFESARKGQQQLAAILTSSSDPILVIDNDERIVLVNPAAGKALGVNIQAIVGKRIGEVISAEPLVQLLKGTADTTEEIEWENDHGQAFAPRVSDILNNDSQSTGRLLIMRDITRYRNLRENQSEFVSTVSHDLRSPLTYMNGYADMLPMVGQLNERQKGFADKISIGIAQMTDLVDKILDASRLDPDGHYQLNREPCDIVILVSEVINTHVIAAEKKGLVLQSEVSEAVPVLNLDEMMVKRALNNLTDNAIKYSPAGGAVTVSASVKDNNLVLSVKDSGLGVSEENQKFLFERFKRVRRREHQTVKGSGLGLYIVRRVAERHNGKAWVESTEGQGSTFLISIPMEGVNLVGASKQ